MASEWGPAPQVPPEPPPGPAPAAAPPPSPEQESPIPRLELVARGFSEAGVALRLGFWIVNNRPGLLLLFLLPQFLLGALNFGLTGGLGLSRDSLAYSTIFILVALVSYVPVMAAAVLEAEAARGGGFLSHTEALREAFRNLQFLMVPVLVVWFGVDALRALVLLPLPLLSFIAQDPEQLLAIAGALGLWVTVVQFLVTLYIAGRLLIALPDRVLSEEEPPKPWPMLLVLGLVIARFAVAGSTEGLTQLGVAELADLQSIGLGSVAALAALNFALLAVLLLSLAGRMPAGLRWSWKASRDLDLLVASLSLVLVLAFVTPRPWVFLTTLLGGSEQALNGLLLYLAVLFLVIGLFGQWGLSVLVTGAMAVLLFIVMPYVPRSPASGLPYVNPFLIASIWVIPLTFLTVSTVSLYFRMTEAE